MFLKHQKKERQPPVATEILYITKKTYIDSPETSC